MPGSEPVTLAIDSDRLRWLGGVLGLYSLAMPPDPGELKDTLPSVSLLRYPEGTDILREGDTGTDLYILHSGEVVILRGGQQVAELGPGALLGEVGFLTESPRTATVRAKHDCEMFRIPSIQTFLSRYPGLKDFLQETAQRRLGELKRLLGEAEAEHGLRPTMRSLETLSHAPSMAHAARQTQPADPPPPKTKTLIVGKYELRGLLGKGGMGWVYEGFDHNLERKIAIKQLVGKSQTSDEARARFIQEAKTIARLTHPFIVGVHDIVEDDGRLYIVMDFVDGKPVSRLLREKGRFTLAECQTVFSYVCPAVACAHWNRVLHRDLKPANIMIERAGYAKVMDFGLARQATDALGRPLREISGTLAYMAPEQHRGESGPASDVYSLAVCLFEMLTGDIPFHGPDYLGQKEAMKYTPPGSLAPGLRDVDALIAVALTPDPRKRMASALSFQEALKQVPAS
ncbi:MAG: protein kinase [Elusimicrobiota bacterium]